jgi:3-methyl-2-oxobutanoate hydroxymethyltransferase
MVPSKLASIITKKINIPTLGIGAGAHTSGQVLVYHDVLGLNPEFKPKFLRTYLNGYESIKNALNDYSNDVKNGTFPSKKESF